MAALVALDRRAENEQRLVQRLVHPPNTRS